MGQISISSMYRSVFLSGFFGLVALILLRFIFRDWVKAGIVATLILVLFLSYGHIYNYIEDLQLGGFLIGRHRYLLLVWVVLMALGLGWITRNTDKLPSFSSTLNLVTTVLLIFPIIQLALYGIRSLPNSAEESLATSHGSSPNTIVMALDNNLPDVYYIILDAYGRSDILLNLFGFDNSPFLGRLRELGFYVADCSQSNYSKTDLSLSSSLNMDYVTNLDPSLTPDKTDRLPLWNLVKDNTVKRMFDDLGYTTIAFETGFDFSHFNNLDLYYTPTQKGFNEFEIFYLRTTLAVLLDEAGIFARFHYTPEDRKRELILFDLETLPEIASLPGPKFVFAHLVIPHQPFVFAPDGDLFVVPERVNKGNTYYTEQDYLLGYRNQVAFISSQIPQVVQEIFENSAVPPIIIVQGDHGPSHFERSDRMGILNAYSFPNANAEFYGTISPVNSFRLLFNTYFATSFDLLEDVSYYSEYPNAYRFEVIPNECNQ